MDAREVAQTQTEFLPDSNEYLIRYFGVDGALLSEQRITADVIDQFNNIHVPNMGYDMDGMRWYDTSGEMVWRADGTGVYVQGTSSDEYRMAGRNLDIDAEIFGPFDTDPEPRFTESEYQMYLDLAVGTTTDRYTDITYGGGSSAFHTRRRDYFEKIFCNGDWGNTEEQPDIEAERGGALDEFLEEFKPHNTTPERSDEQE